MPNRRGFTLVEVLIAIVLIDIGLLALAGASATIARQTNALRLRNAALRTATNRVQQLGVVPCAAAAGSFATPDGIQETWSIALAGTFRDVSDSVAFGATRSGNAAHAIVLRTRLPC